MPVSKKRKTTGKRRMPAPASAERPKQWAIKLSGSRLAFLKNDPDFLTMIKIGRAVNAVEFALLAALGHAEEKTVTDKLMRRRACFVLGGYLHQGIALINSIKGRYLTEPGFEKLRLLTLSEEHRKVRSYAKRVRNHAAFHLDEYDESTRRTLVGLKPTTYPLMSWDEQSMYFEFADLIDLAFQVDGFANGRNWDETASDIIDSITMTSQEFLIGCSEFLMSLSEKTKIREHSY